MRPLAVALLLALPCSVTATSVTDFGAVCDGVTDDTVAIQTALDWVAGAHDVLYTPVGHCKVTATLTLVQKTNFSVRGVTRQGGTYTSSWRWAGVVGGTMLLLDGVRDSEWADFALDVGIGAGEPAVMLDVDKLTAGTTVPRNNAFRRMLIRGGSLATVRIANTSLANNEANLFEDVQIASIPGSLWVNGVPGGPIGYLVKNVNAKGQQVVRGTISGKEAAVQINDGSLHLHGVELSGNNVWVRKGGGGEPLIIENCDGDSSKTFLEVTLAQTGPVIAKGNRFIQAYDGPLFIFGDTLGPVTLLGNEFAGGGHRTAAQSFSTIPGNGPVVTAIGNTFPNDQILPVPALQATKLRALYSLGNIYYGPGNTRHFLPDNLVPNRTSGAQVASLRIGGASGFSGDVQSINIATLQINPNQPTVFLSATANHSLTSVPTFRPGMFDGQEVRLVNIGNFSVGLIDRNSLAGSALSLVTPTVLIPPRGSVSLTWYFNAWYQTSPVLSPL
jgi:hypothetical protein